MLSKYPRWKFGARQEAYLGKRGFLDGRDITCVIHHKVFQDTVLVPSRLVDAKDRGWGRSGNMKEMFQGAP